MSLLEDLKRLSQRVMEQKEFFTTEEATKQGAVLKFIEALGYNFFDISEVVPEFTADHGRKQAEKVDYAIMRDGKPVILIECKKANDPLDAGRAEQLARYLNMTDARFGILTNGIVYKFYGEFNQKNRMDTKPFLEINLDNLNESNVDALNKLHLDKASLDVEKGYSAAEKLKYIGGMKEYLRKMYNQPDKDFVTLLARQVYDHNMTQKVVISFTDLVRQAFHDVVSDESRKEATKALERASSINTTQENPEASVIDRSGVGRPDDPYAEVAEGKNREPTDQEIEGYEMVRNIAGQVVDQKRITMRTLKSSCAVLLDNSQQKCICRLHFQAANVMKLRLLDEAKHETFHSLNSLDDISKYAVQIRKTVARYLHK